MKRGGDSTTLQLAHRRPRRRHRPSGSGPMQSSLLQGRTVVIVELEGVERIEETWRIGKT